MRLILAVLLAATPVLAEGDITATPDEPGSAMAAGGSASEAAAAEPVAYACEDGRVLAVGYPDTETAALAIDGGELVELTIAVSASGARYVGDGWEWWANGMTEGWLAPLAEGEEIATTAAVLCIVPAEGMNGMGGADDPAVSD